MTHQAGVRSDKIKLLVVQGPTASGKTAFAVELAERYGGEIVNADAVQVYRRLDIGTAKPSAELRRRVPHHLLDIVDPDEEFTAADFRRRAAAAIADIHGRGKRALLVGGTGLYIRALTRGLASSPGGDDAIRAELEAQVHREGPLSLHRRLEELDPVTAARLHPNDRVRIVRALEVFLTTGHPLSSFQDAHRFGEAPYDCFKLGIAVAREELYRRIEERVDRMIADGLVDEVRGLIAAGYPPTLKALGSIGYREVCSHLAGAYPLDEAIRLIKQHTRNYAKRQLTWFRKDSEILWVEYPGKSATIDSNVMEFYG